LGSEEGADIFLTVIVYVPVTGGLKEISWTLPLLLCDL